MQELEFVYEFQKPEEAQAALGHLSWLQFNGHNVSGCAENGSSVTITVWFRRHDPDQVEELRNELGALSATPAQPTQNDDRPQATAVFILFT